MSLEGEIFSQDRYYHPRPDPGGKVPIQVLNFRRVVAAWSPKLKNTLYFEKAPEEPEEEGLKRVREIVLLQVYDWLAGREGLIELTEPEFEQFTSVYEAFLQQSGEIRYSRHKKGRKTENLFELQEFPYLIREVKKGPFSDKL
ncbi:MAG: hypothetical protein PHF18_04520 [Methanosarcina sp.]|uniref:hypothetical protein n=1 Tax=Methanosarcina sp. TaxID=2213 RepID=UPI0026331680|nr:hypothetical protein [Methanosarcina sp.]MDD3246111.1 hypothetical protein [Methanosarcina sp.]